jgi:superoxide dismutase, Fe-Mn family
LAMQSLQGLALADGMISKLPMPKSHSPKLKKESFEKTLATVLAPEPITALVFQERLKTVQGLTPLQLEKHIGLYEGYVKRLNEINEKIAGFTDETELAKANVTYHPLRELHIEKSFAHNGVLFHELYFGNLGGDRTAPSAGLKAAFERRFGSWANYMNQLKSLGKSMRGWVITGFNLRDHSIQNYGLDSHNLYAPMDVVPILVLDVFEHAYMIDFATDRGKYLDAFFENLDWSIVENRLVAAIAHHSASFTK